MFNQGRSLDICLISKSPSSLCQYPRALPVKGISQFLLLSRISRMAKGECDSIKHISQARLFRVKSCQVQLFIYPLNKPICFHPLQSTQIISDYNSILFTVSLTPREARRRKRARPHTRPLPDDLPIPHYHFVPLFHTCRCYQPGILIGPFGPFGILFSPKNIAWLTRHFENLFSAGGPP